MNPEHQKQVAQYVSEFHLPRYREIPDIGLHLEQVARYVNRYAVSPLTGSMISNYVKHKIIPGPTKKYYSRDSIAYLIFVSYIKSVMPLEDIRAMMDVQQSSYAMEIAYNYFCDEFENLLQYVSGLKAEPDAIGRTSTDQKELLRTALLSITYKLYLEQCLRLLQPGTEVPGE